MSDDDLLRRAQQGDLRALDRLFRREWRPVYGLIYHRVQDRAEAQDLTQEVFLRALRGLDRYEQRGVPFRAFLTTVARNLLRDRWRRQGPTLVTIDHAAHLPAVTAGPEQQVLTRLTADQLRAHLATLPPDYQTVLRLRLIEDRPVAEVATLMGRSPGAVRTLQHRALAALRSRVVEEGVRR
ncbi:RNA polymerase sigma factor [Sphaerobacter thermophilus]|jgi:RNA polymerase sigma-70 factor (ECF subfamily)|uniref:RNA polymerase sigma factor n=1 Tax=Sphaerobacter thermophilus (strain ATCC 49802 / DSM 20745 / KCCM 41009 / NCIMB 13125 / S 6022) TaxID=479434 RepID=D1C7C1_SPHTD|nr:sigma-70 family RNA polymerase sigma factor [Sphaerobacter thermophilus]ACZ39767.1 RNA polymerase, sigma-24 subunit, ECF subfamily [Sphaerobacter thermophilus DSM 20745]PZN60784.1 MAG: RNA polymerase subunit sigma-24 [Sphaerobacter thermophilus]